MIEQTMQDSSSVHTRMNDFSVSTGRSETLIETPSTDNSLQSTDHAGVSRMSWPHWVGKLCTTLKHTKACQGQQAVTLKSPPTLDVLLEYSGLLHRDECGAAIQAKYPCKCLVRAYDGKKCKISTEVRPPAAPTCCASLGRHPR